MTQHRLCLCGEIGPVAEMGGAFMYKKGRQEAERRARRFARPDHHTGRGAANARLNGQNRDRTKPLPKRGKAIGQAFGGLDQGQPPFGQ